MKCNVISISHKPSDWEKQAVQFYSKQLPNHFQVSHIALKPFSSKSLDQKSAFEAEGFEILKYVDQDAHVILWDRQGKKINSLDFASLLQNHLDQGRDINFIIGAELNIRLITRKNGCQIYALMGRNYPFAIGKV